MPIDLPPFVEVKAAIIRSGAGLINGEVFSTFPFPVFCPAATAVITAIVQQASATSTGTTITAPADIQAGDLLVLLDRALGIGLPTSATPTDFVQVDERNDGGSTRQILSRKLANGSESGASLSGMAAGVGGAVRKILLVFRPNVPAASLSVLDVAGEQTDNNPSAQTVNASSGVRPLVVLGAYGSSGTVNPRTFTVGGSAAKDGEVENQPGSNVNIALAWKIYNSSPADVVVDMDDEGTENILQSCYIEMTA